MTTLHQVADFFVELSHQATNPVPKLKLQKLLYYAQAWHLALENSPLFPDQFEAWIHGPVIPSLFREFPTLHNWDPIPRPMHSSDLCAWQEFHIQEVFAAYGSLSGAELTRLVQQEAPWQIARIGLAPTQDGHAEISHTSMKEFYTNLLLSRSEP